MTSDALSFAVSGACLLSIRSREPGIAEGDGEPRPRLRAQIGQGLGYIAGDPILRRAVAWSGTANFFVIIVETLGPVFLIRSVHLRPASVGVLLGWGLALFALGWMSRTFGSTLCAIALTSYQRATCPARLRGRVSAASRWVNWGTLPLGGLAGGALGATLGVHLTLWIAVIGGCSSGLWLYLSPLRRIRDLPTVSLQAA
jgi:hypothetical protein